MNNSTVREVDPSGKDVWSFKTFQGVFRATLLPNGNVLVSGSLYLVGEILTLRAVQQT